MYRIQLHLFSFEGRTKIKILPLQMIGNWVKTMMSKNWTKTIQRKTDKKSSQKFIKKAIIFSLFKIIINKQSKIKINSKVINILVPKYVL